MPPSIVKGAHLGFCRADGGAVAVGAKGRGHSLGVHPGVSGAVKIFGVVVLEPFVKWIVPAVVAVELAVRSAGVVVIVSTMVLVQPLHVC